MPSTPIVVTLDYLTMLYPEFADETPDRIAALDTWATGLVSFGVFGKNYLYAKPFLGKSQIANKKKLIAKSHFCADAHRAITFPRPHGLLIALYRPLISHV